MKEIQERQRRFLIENMDTIQQIIENDLINEFYADPTKYNDDYSEYDYINDCYKAKYNELLNSGEIYNLV